MSTDTKNRALAVLLRDSDGETWELACEAAGFDPTAVVNEQPPELARYRAFIRQHEPKPSVREAVDEWLQENTGTDGLDEVLPCDASAANMLDVARYVLEALVSSSVVGDPATDPASECVWRAWRAVRDVADAANGCFKRPAPEDPLSVALGDKAVCVVCDCPIIEGSQVLRHIGSDAAAHMECGDASNYK